MLPVYTVHTQYNTRSSRCTNAGWEICRPTLTCNCCRYYTVYTPHSSLGMDRKPIVPWLVVSGRALSLLQHSLDCLGQRKGKNKEKGTYRAAIQHAACINAACTRMQVPTPRGLKVRDVNTILHAMREFRRGLVTLAISIRQLRGERCRHVMHTYVCTLAGTGRSIDRCNALYVTHV